MERKKMDNDLYEAPAYGIAEASSLLQVNPNRVRRWLYGYSYKWDSHGEMKTNRQPSIARRGENQGQTPASFLDLMELLFAKSFLKSGFSLREVRAALEEARARTKLRHPFATKMFFTMGRDIMLELRDPRTKEPYLLNLLSKGQLALRAIVLQVAKKIEFDYTSGLANVWWPMGRDCHVAVTPKICFGEPAIANRGIKTSVVYDLYKAEKGNEEAVGYWFNLNTDEVRAAARFEESIKATA
jgi:uncharacterized protein (DUF433 family)